MIYQRVFDYKLNIRYNRGMKIIIIDGMSGAGKTTYANSISQNVIHMDDFFLPIELRTEERLAEIGGNVHYERFKDEVINPIKSGEKEFSYRIFNCKEMNYVSAKKIRTDEDIIIEGAYAMHPYFEWDKLKQEFEIEKVFMEIPKSEQEARIKARNGKTVWEIFRDKWIPMEEAYFDKFIR